MVTPSSSGLVSHHCPCHACLLLARPVSFTLGDVLPLSSRLPTKVEMLHDGRVLTA